MARTHRDLEVYQLAFKAATEVFKLTKRLPSDERFALSDQIRRSSRPVTANLAEAWRKRRYEGSFVLKLNDAEAEAAETQSWLEHAVECGYTDKPAARELYSAYDHILGMIVNMINNPAPWLLSAQNGKR